jgi:hypothetical protein
MHSNERSAQLVLLCIMFFLFFNYPLMRIFDRAWLVGGFPVLYLFLFAGWLLMIAWIYWILRKPEKP